MSPVTPRDPSRPLVVLRAPGDHHRGGRCLPGGLALLAGAASAGAGLPFCATWGGARPPTSPWSKDLVTGQGGDRLWARERAFEELLDFQLARLARDLPGRLQVLGRKLPFEPDEPAERRPSR